MKRELIWPAFGMAMGSLLGAIGFPFSTWQFWAVFLLALAWAIAERKLGDSHAG
jgi:hypothetical protein